MKTRFSTYSLFFISMLAAILFVGCESKDSISYSEAKIKVNLPDAMEDKNVTPDGLNVKFINLSNGSETTATTNANGEVAISLEDGLYKIQVTGTKTYGYVFGEDDGQTTQVTKKIAGSIDNIVISASTGNVLIDLSIEIEGKGWVIKEIYYSGTKTPAGSSYSKDQFVEIYNNTDSVLYADGISLAQTINLTSKLNSDYAPQLNQSTYVHTIYTIPGTGKDHPVQPGTSILIAPQPINHKEHNANSFDLSSADFQWYDAHATLAIDVPEVPNMIKYYSYSNTIWIMQVGGNRSILIFKADNMADYYNANVDSRLNDAGKIAISVKVDNELILDAVELATGNQLLSKSLAPSVDLSYTYCTDTYSGKSVRRKVEKRVGERVVYQDTNNSLEDFIPNTIPQPKVFQ